MSQDELAEKVGVSRQSVSLWETGQTQPTIDNIIALTKIFNISSDTLLGNGSCPEAPQTELPETPTALPERLTAKKQGAKPPLAIIGIIAAAVIALAVFAMSLGGCSPDEGGSGPYPSDSSVSRAPTETSSVADASSGEDASAVDTDPEEVPPAVSTPEEPASETNDNTGSGTGAVTPVPDQTPPEAPPAVSTPIEPVPTPSTGSSEPPPVSDPAPDAVPFDLFAYCRDFAIETGNLYGDYCIYQQPATMYGGYENEYFSISYWNDSNMVEFSLHCPLSETYSHNFYLRMRGGYNGKYEYVSSKYFRDTGESLREASGYIDPAAFSPYYPISCDNYYGSLDGQDQFMEDSRVGMCDLIWCLKQFVTVENMACTFSDFEFVNF